MPVLNIQSLITLNIPKRKNRRYGPLCFQLRLLGTVLGFIISFGTTTGFDGHNQVWFHVPALYRERRRYKEERCDQLATWRPTLSLSSTTYVKKIAFTMKRFLPKYSLPSNIS
ncbi:hypothetical protein SCLCIDRAFT_307245 [Scleroderma citrinum Foug A]|uniref:Uncharacterized protein n=1 Tax=Scleroderma citrinum Foug A TaxID=1036808 RepID=A0A0C3DH14_9AGAM|nr:hypothetical protein SCLCIDRAFT_307245 [Scleroderma citrinum Foug A]